MRPRTNLPSSERLLAIIDLQNAVAASRMDSASVMRVVVDNAAALTGATGTVVEIVDGDHLVYEVAAGTLAHTAGLRLARADSLSGRCVRDRAALVCHDSETDDRVDREACRRVGARAMVCVPLFHESEAVGVLKVVAVEPNVFDDEDVLTLELLARTIGVSLHQAKVHEAAVFASLHDSLTGLGNRRAFDARLSEEYERWRRYQHPLTLATFDLDGFKALNDRFGHSAGDEALRAFACLLRAQTRSTDRAFRLGGDEFALLLPDTPIAGARLVVERIVQRTATLPEGHAMIGASAGIAEPSQDGVIAFAARADVALYADKRYRKGDFGGEDEASAVAAAQTH